MEKDKIIEIGKVNGFHGVRGFVKVFSETRPREAILAYSSFLIKKGKEWETIEVKEGREHGKNILFLFKEYEDRNLVESLLGAPLAVYRSQMPELPEGEFYWVDLMGLTVRNESGVIFGKIDSIMETGANDVLVVKDEKGAPTYIPYAFGEVVLEVDYEAGEMIVDWSEDEA